MAQTRLTRRSLLALAAPAGAVLLGSSTTFAQATPQATPAGVQPALPATTTDASGESVTVTDISRIVPLSGDIAEILWQLGLGGNLVGADVSAVYPAEVMDPLPKIGFERNLAAEGILSLEPTLVIGKTTAGPEGVLDQVREAGVTVVIVDDHASVKGVIAKIQRVGEAVGLPEEARAIAIDTQADVDAAIALAGQATSQPRVAFVYVREGGVQMLGGRGSGADSLIEAAGAIDVGVDTGVNGFIPITAEAMVAANPDYILVPASGVESIGGLDALLEIPGIAQTPAAENDAILIYDDLEFLGLTPRIGEMLMQLVVALHPELAGATPAA